MKPGESSLYGDKAMGFNSLQGQKIFLLSITSRSELRPIQPPVQWIPEAPYPGLKRPGSEASHSPPYTAKVMNEGAIPPLPDKSSLLSA
jgi:hypothetical protein